MATVPVSPTLNQSIKSASNTSTSKPNMTQNQRHCVSDSMSLLLLYLESNLPNRPSWLQCEVASFTHLPMRPRW